MPQVASDINAHALKPTFAHARPPQPPDRAPPTPFESLLDDAQAPPSRPASDDNPPRVDSSRRTDRAKDSKAADSSDDANAAPPPEDKPDVKSDAKPDAETDSKSDVKSGKPVVVAETKPADDDIKTDKPETDTDGTSDGKPAADVKTGEQAANIVDVKPAGDAKPVNVPLPVDSTAVVPPAPTITPANAIATALVPAPVVVAQAASSADTTAITATTQLKTGASTSLQVDADKSTDEQKALAKTALQSQSDVKPQTATGDSDKDSVAQFRGEAPVNSHRGAGPETPATVTPDANLVAPKTGADTMPPALLNAPSHNNAPAVTNLAVTPQLSPQATPIPLSGLAFEITNKALAGNNHFEIRLDPPELGRIEVRLDVDRDGNVTSRMIADRADTLDLLRRDAPGLERALQDAGLKTADNSLQFSLRDQSMGQQQTRDSADTARLAAQDEALAAITPTQIDYSRLAARAGGLDIRV